MLKILIVVLVVLGWFTAIVAGFLSMEKYEATPGSGATTQIQQTTKIGKWRFVLVVSSACPCSRASMSALKSAVESHPDSTETEVIFADRPNQNDWLYQKAKSIRGCVITTTAPDRQGARTSGQAFLYNPSGKLVYSGGLTQGRGIDDSRYAMRLYDDLRSNSRAQKSGPVFGCALPGESK